MIFALMKRILLYSAIGCSLLVMACMAEILYGSGMTHPIWDRNYNWTPIVILILAASMTAATLRTLIPQIKAPVKNPIRIKVSHDFGREYPIAIRGV